MIDCLLGYIVKDCHLCMPKLLLSCRRRVPWYECVPRCIKHFRDRQWDSSQGPVGALYVRTVKDGSSMKKDRACLQGRHSMRYRKRSQSLPSPSSPFVLQVQANDYQVGAHSVTPLPAKVAFAFVVALEFLMNLCCNLFFSLGRTSFSS